MSLVVTLYEKSKHASDLRFQSIELYVRHFMWLSVTDFSKTLPLASVWIITLQSFIHDVDATPLRTNRNLLFWKKLYIFCQVVLVLPFWFIPNWQRKFQNLSGKGSLPGLLLYGPSCYQTTTFCKLSINKSKGQAVDLNSQVFLRDRVNASCGVSKQDKIPFARSENDDVMK